MLKIKRAASSAHLKPAKSVVFGDEPPKAISRNNQAKSMQKLRPSTAHDECPVPERQSNCESAVKGIQVYDRERIPLVPFLQKYKNVDQKLTVKKSDGSTLLIVKEAC